MVSVLFSLTTKIFSERLLQESVKKRREMNGKEVSIQRSNDRWQKGISSQRSDALRVFGIGRLSATERKVEGDDERDEGRDLSKRDSTVYWTTSSTHKILRT